MQTVRLIGFIDAINYSKNRFLCSWNTFFDQNEIWKCKVSNNQVDRDAADDDDNDNDNGNGDDDDNGNDDNGYDNDNYDNGDDTDNNGDDNDNDNDDSDNNNDNDGSIRRWLIFIVSAFLKNYPKFWEIYDLLVAT